MALFDQTLTIEGRLEDIWQRIQGEVTPEQQVVVNKPNMTLLTLDKQYGYLYIMCTTSEGAVKLRHMVDTASRVREVFRTAQGSERLSLLAQATDNVDPDERRFIADEAQQRIGTIQRVGKRKPKAVELHFEGSLQDEPSSPFGDLGKSKRSGDLPGDPRSYIGYTFFVTTIGVGIAYALNWKRLGKPQWMIPTIILAILMPALMIMGLFPLVWIVSSRPEFLRWGVFGALTLFGCNWGLLFALMYLQYSPYMKWKNGDGKGMNSHHYDFINATLLTFGVGLAAGLIGLFVKLPNYGPQTYRSDLVEITYPYDWTAQSFSDYSFCSDSNIDCELIIGRNNGSEYISFYWVYLDEPQSLGEYAVARWGRIMNQSPDAVAPLPFGHLQVNGREARFREYEDYYDDSEPPWHIMVVYLQWNERTILSITASSLSGSTFSEHRQEFNTIIQSLRLRSLE